MIVTQNFMLMLLHWNDPLMKIFRFERDFPLTFRHRSFNPESLRFI